MDEILKALGEVPVGDYFGYFLLIVICYFALLSVNTKKKKKIEVKTLERRKKNEH